MEPPIGSSPLPDVSSQSHPFQVSDVLRAVRDLAYDLPENEADCNEAYSDVIPPPSPSQDTCYTGAQVPVCTEEIVTDTSSPVIMYDMDGYIERTSSRTSYLLPNVRLVTQDTLTIGPSAQPHGALSDSALNTALDSRLRLLQSQISRQPEEGTCVSSSQERRPRKGVDDYDMEADVEINVIDSDSDGNYEEDNSYEAEPSPTHPKTIPYSELVVYDHDYEIFPGEAGDYNNGLERVPLFPNTDRQRFSSHASSITSAKGPVQRRMEMDSQTREKCEEAPKRRPGRPSNNKLSRMPNSSVPPLEVPLIRDTRARSSLELREDNMSQLLPNLSGSFSFPRQSKNCSQNKARPPSVSIGGVPFQLQPVDLEVTYRCHQCDRHRRLGYRHQCRPVPKQLSSIDRDRDLPYQPPCGSVPNVVLPVSAKVMLADTDATPQQRPDRTGHRVPVKHPLLRGLLTQEFLAAEAEGQRQVKESHKHETEEIMELDAAQETEVTPSANTPRPSHLPKRLPEENVSSRPQEKRQKRAKRTKRPSRANSYSKPTESVWSRDKMYTCEEIETMDLLSDNGADDSAAGNTGSGCRTNEKYIDVVNSNSEVSEEEEDMSRERERTYGTTNVSSNDEEGNVSMGVSPSFKMRLRRRRRSTNSTVHSYNTRFGRNSEDGCEYKNDDMFDANWDFYSKRNVLQLQCPTSPTCEQDTHVSAPKSTKRGRGRPRKRALTSTGSMATSARKEGEQRCGTNGECDDEQDRKVTVRHRRTRRFRDGIPWFVAEKRAKQLSKENKIDLDVCRVLCKDIVCKLEIDESRAKKRTESRKSSKPSSKPRTVKCHPTESEPVCVASDSKYRFSGSDVESCETSDDADGGYCESDYRFHSNTPGIGLRRDEPPMHDCIIDSTADEDDSEISAGFPAYPASARVVAEPLYPYEPDLSEPEPDLATHCVSADSGIGSEQLNLSNVSTTVDGDISLVSGRSEHLATSIVVISVVESVQLRVREPERVELQGEEMPHSSAIEASEVPHVPDSDERDLPSSSSAVEELEPQSQLNTEVQGSTVLITTDEDESVAPSDDVAPSNVPQFDEVENCEVDSEMSNLTHDVNEVVLNVVERASELVYGNVRNMENEKESEEHGGDEVLVVEQQSQSEPTRQCTVLSTTAAEDEDDDIIWEAPLQCSKIQATSTSTANENNEDDEIFWEAPTQVQTQIHPTSNEDDDDDIIWEKPVFIQRRKTDVPPPKRRAKSCSVNKKASTLPVLAACRLVPLQYTRSIVDRAVVQSRKLADYLTNRAYEIANWLNDWKSIHEPARLVNTTAVADAVLKYWSHVSVTAPFLSDWQRLERETREDSLERCSAVDRLYASMLFDPSKWKILYAEWKQRLQLERLPYFDEYGIPTVTGMASEFGNYVARTQGSAEFPDLDSLYRFSMLFTDVRKARAEDVEICSIETGVYARGSSNAFTMEKTRYRDDAMVYCPCNASFLSRILVLARYKIPHMDYFMRCELVYLLATSLSRAKKCFLHSSIRNPMKTCDDNLRTMKKKVLSTSAKIREEKGRSRRSKSVEPDFVKEYEEVDFSDIERTLSAKRYEMKCALTKLECERQRNGNLFRRSQEPEPPRRVGTSIPTSRKREKVDVNRMDPCRKKSNYGSTK